MKIAAIIPARGQSKRIPRKNIKEFCGKPIIYYSIEAAKNSGMFDEIMVSTDDNEIAGIAVNYGAHVPFLRSKSTSDDYAVTSDVLLEVINKYEQIGLKFDHICCIYPTAPFITAEKLKKAYETFLSSGADSLLPVVKFSFPPQRGITLNHNMVTMLHPEYLNTRSQDLEPVYHDCGQFYFTKTDAFCRTGKLIADKTAAIIFPETEVQDIDSEDDWQLAEIKYKYMKDKLKQV